MSDAASNETTGFVPQSAKGKPIQLAMQSLWLTGRVLPFGARLWVRHEFESAEANPLEVIYGFMLPRDAALRRFRISGEGFTVSSELRPTKEAREAYEEGLRAGSLSTLAQQYRDGLINLTVGNIRPKEKVVVLLEIVAGVELRDDGLRLRFPFTLAPSYHASARRIEADPGVGELELPEEEFGDLILPRFAQDAKGLHQVGFALDVQMGEGVEEIASPSHAIRVQGDGRTFSRVMLARESDLPNRDLVLDVRRKADGTSSFAGIDAGGRGRFAAVVPSTQFGSRSDAPRRLVVLLDRSGSMQGSPIVQAKKAIEACMATLDPRDQFGLVAFDNDVEIFKTRLAESNSENRHSASTFLQAIGARGGTELASGIEAAAKLLEDKPGDILIFTDGQVFATEAILARARACGMRLHALGIGSASQDRFLAQLASHTGGVSRFVTPNERVDMAAVELFAAIGRPVAEDVRITVNGMDGSRIAPEPSKYVFAGTPLLVFGDAAGAGRAEIQLDWKTAEGPRTLRIPIVLEANTIAGTLKLEQGSRLISDMESRIEPTSSGVLDKRRTSRVHEALEALSREYGLASSAMSLVAVVKRATDVAGAIPETRVVMVGMPQEMEFQNLFACAVPMAVPMSVGAPAEARSKAANLFRVSNPASTLRRMFGGGDKTPASDAGSVLHYHREPASTPADTLIELAARMEPDGGMPGTSEDLRIANSLAALLAFWSEGNTRDTGTFRLHVEKLMRFLDSHLQRLEGERLESASRVLQQFAAGQIPPGDWLAHANPLVQSKDVDSKRFWRELAVKVKA